MRGLFLGAALLVAACQQSCAASLAPAQVNATAAVAAYAGLSQAALLNATGGKCSAMQVDALVETFSSPALNTTRWEASSTHGLFHCPKGSTTKGVGKAGADRFCTMALASNLVTGAPLPFLPGSALGAALTLSRSPCDSGDPTQAALCCRGAALDKCANFSGAHLVSRFCILYGTLSATMSIKIPGATASNPGSSAMFDLGTYVNGGAPDSSWNEVDQIFQVGPNGTVEFHTTYFDPAEHKQVFGLYSRHPYDGYIATAYRNYSVVWTPHFVAWTVDHIVYRNTSGESKNTPPWRPQSVRLILRTNNGSIPDLPVPDAHVYIHSLAYTPLPPAPVPDVAGLLRLAAALAPSSGPGFLLRCATWAATWAAGAHFLRDALRWEADDAAHMEQVARQRTKTVASLTAERRQTLQQQQQQQAGG